MIHSTSPPKTCKKRVPSAHLFALYSPVESSRRNWFNLRKCKVLLHLGNSIAFLIDNRGPLPYDFCYRHSFGRKL